MKKEFGGPAIFLDRSDINTDEIIPARYLTEVTKDALKPYILEDLEMEGFDPKGEKLAKAKVIVTRDNFGCGSSREHAPWVLEVNDVTAVIAEGFARIFRQNMYNCGMMALELPKEDIDTLMEMGQKCDVNIDICPDKGEIIASCCGESNTFSIRLEGFDKALVDAGGWVEFADARY